MRIKLCPDPMIKTLRDVFGANIIRVPEERYLPMTSLVDAGNKPKFWGGLLKTIEGAPIINPPIHESKMADVSGKSTKETNIDIGLEILDGFLKGFGLSDFSGSIKSKFSGAQTVSFSFKDVIRKYIEPADLDLSLAGKMLNPELSLTQQIMDGKAELYVIDSVITSSDFSINVEKSKDSQFKLDVPSIEGFISNAGLDIKVKSNSTKDITFSGEKHLAFAFSCLECVADFSGRIILKPGVIITLDRDIKRQVNRALLSDDLEMMDIE